MARLESEGARLTRSDYGGAFYEERHRKTERSAEKLLGFLFSEVLCRVPESVVDVGCGVGTWLAVAKKMGVARVKGIEGNWVPISSMMISPEELVVHDINAACPDNDRYELAICLEVGEHLEAASADVLVKSLAGMADVILFSAAIPWQGGVGHVNEQWPEYWAAKFRAHGYQVFDGLRSKFWDDELIALHYRQNIFLCARGEAPESFGGSKVLFATERLGGFVQPGLYTDHLLRQSSLRCCVGFTARAARRWLLRCARGGRDKAQREIETG